jgi:hypothetical protein
MSVALQPAQVARNGVLRRRLQPIDEFRIEAAGTLRRR